MATYNGFLTNFVYGSTTLNPQLATIGTSGVVATVPAKWFQQALFSVVTTQGLSGSFFATIYGYVGGASIVIAGVTAVSAVGSKIVGATPSILGCPRPAFVTVQPTGAAAVGFTASFYMAGEYE
jgi:hypothetical protein